MSRRRARWQVVAAVAALVLAGCGGNESSGADGTEAVSVVTSLYPLQFTVERVGGDLVSSTNLSPASAEPHDLELTPRGAASLHSADLVVHLSGFAPAIDDAVAELDPGRAFDAGAAAGLDEQHEDEQEHTGDDGHGHRGPDPHFWLDPTRLADVADAIAERLGELDPAHARAYRTNAATLRAELDELDHEFTAGLADCAHSDIVTSHAAFGHLAERYGLRQVSVTGLSPDDEPSPAEIADVTEFVRAHSVSTVFHDPLVDPTIAETVADETGASTMVLDPIETVTPDSAGTDYFAVMRSNLDALRRGLECT